MFLCENEYFMISNLHWSFTTVSSCHLVLLYVLREINTFISICLYPFNILKKLQSDHLLTLLYLGMLNHIILALLITMVSQFWNNFSCSILYSFKIIHHLLMIWYPRLYTVF